MCNNQSSKAFAKKPTNHNRLKYIKVQNHHKREQIEYKIVELKYCPTLYMVANIFTKFLATYNHELLRELMGLEYNVTLQSGKTGG